MKTDVRVWVKLFIVLLEYYMYINHYTKIQIIMEVLCVLENNLAFIVKKCSG